MNGWPETKKDVDEEIRPYFQMKEELTVSDDIIFRGNRVIIPAELRKDILQQIHSGHVGIQGCLNRAREIVYWPNMTS